MIPARTRLKMLILEADEQALDEIIKAIITVLFESGKEPEHE